eukprot:gene1252-biopygen481
MADNTSVVVKEDKVRHRIRLADYSDGADASSISILVGADNLARFFTGCVKRGETAERLMAYETTLGWVLSGPVPCDRRSLSCAANMVSTHVLRISAGNPVVLESQSSATSESAPSLCNRLWDLESVGIGNEDTVYDTVTKNITMTKCGKYNVKLLSKEEHEILPDNYEWSVARLNSLLNRLRKDPDLLREYDKIIQDQLQAGIVERVVVSEKKDVGEKILSAQRGNGGGDAPQFLRRRLDLRGSKRRIMMKFKEARACLSSGGFNLRKWASNSAEIMEKIDEQLKQEEVVNSGDEESFAKVSVGG